VGLAGRPLGPARILNLEPSGFEAAREGTIELHSVGGAGRVVKTLGRSLFRVRDLVAEDELSPEPVGGLFRVEGGT
jgi:hypothetical protein